MDNKEKISGGKIKKKNGKNYELFSKSLDLAQIGKRIKHAQD
jgi:hypothetical protein